FDYGGLVAGQRVLIQGAGGGVGVVAVQLARAAGSAVIGTGRAWARELVGELGAGSFVDVERERFEDVVRQVDLVFDLVGGEVLDRSWCRSSRTPTIQHRLGAAMRAGFSSSWRRTAQSLSSSPAALPRATCDRSSARCCRWPEAGTHSNANTVTAFRARRSCRWTTRSSSRAE